LLVVSGIKVPISPEQEAAKACQKGNVAAFLKVRAAGTCTKTSAVFGKQYIHVVTPPVLAQFELQCIGFGSKGSRKALKLNYHSGRKDNFSTGTPPGHGYATGHGYRYARIQGQLLTGPIGGITAPLKLYFNPTRRDYFSTATPQGRNDAPKAGYKLVRIQGYVYKHQAPGTVPLKLFWSGSRKDNFSAATPKGYAATKQGYAFIRTEGYIFPVFKP